MNDIENDTNYQTSIDTPSASKNEHFIYDDNFQNLITISDDIYSKTQVKPSIKKLVNLMIEKSDIDAIREQLINQYS